MVKCYLRKIDPRGQRLGGRLAALLLRGHAAARASSIGSGLAPTQIVMNMLIVSAPAVANF